MTEEIAFSCLVHEAFKCVCLKLVVVVLGHYIVNLQAKNVLIYGLTD